MSLTLGDTKTYIDALVASGADALSNLYYIQFLSSKTGLVDEDIAAALTIRSSNLSLPTATHGEQENHFITTSVLLPTADISIDKVLSMSFRIDSHYDVYKFLLQQQAVTAVPNLAYAATLLSEEKEAQKQGRANKGFTIRVYAADQGISSMDQEVPAAGYKGLIPAKDWKEMYEFRYCWIEKLTPLEFSNDSSDAQSVTATIAFMDYSDPQNLLS